jgi:hypothetical protein
VLRRVLDEPGCGGGEIGGERDVVERERAAGVAERRGAHQIDPAPGLSAQRLDGLDRAAGAREIGELALDLDEKTRRRGPRQQRRAPHRDHRSAARDGLPFARRQQLSGADAARERAGEDRPPERLDGRHQLAGASDTLGRRNRQHAELRHRLPEAGGEASGGRLHDCVAAAIAAELAGCVVDRLLRIVEGEVEAHYVRHQRASATARRCPATPPASSRSA